MDYEKWMTKAKHSLEASLEVNDTFELKSLFLQCEWEKLSVGERRSFGRYFSAAVLEGRVENVRKYGEEKSKHNRYKKIK